MKKSKTTIVWFRLDLRVDDNPALAAAIASGDTVVPVYLHVPHEAKPWSMGAASQWWLHHSLVALQSRLDDIGLSLLIRSPETSFQGLQALFVETDAQRLMFNRRCEPAFVPRDALIEQRLQDTQIEVACFNSDLWLDPWEIATDQGQPYRVFTPFWRKLRGRISACMPNPRAPYAGPRQSLPGHSVDQLELLPKRGWADGFHASWRPGELGALENLESFLGGDVAAYATARDVPSLPSTSRLSPHLAFGEIGPRQILASCLNRLGQKCADPLSRAEPFLREIAWREFSKHLLCHFPHSADGNLNSRFNSFQWNSVDESQMHRWQYGATGIPIVDAGMRELWQTGWMHNRVRMIVASFLTKNMRLHWSHGAKWFWDTLLDADLANNTQGWQWTAGTGADAAPYFRIFNPVSQGERFDPKGVYVRQWVPELKDYPDKFVHAPWLAPLSVRMAMEERQDQYPAPMLDLARSRAEALSAFQAMKN